MLSETEFAVRITHANKTPLESVGLQVCSDLLRLFRAIHPHTIMIQVWRGALVLCEYILHHRDLFSGSHCLEVGAGAGLVSALLALVGAHPVATDIGNDVLDNCDENMRRHAGPSLVRHLDWLDPPCCLASGDTPHTCTYTPPPSVPEQYHFTKKDAQWFSQYVEWIFAADVVYIEPCTDALVLLLRKLLNPSRYTRPKTCLLAIEKRINFTIEGIAVAAV
jgi:predicted nicotinamide N-methyase